MGKATPAATMPACQGARKKIVDVDIGRLPGGVNPRGVRRRRAARGGRPGLAVDLDVELLGPTPSTAASGREVISLPRTVQT